MSLVNITFTNARRYVYMEPLSSQSKVMGFRCSVDEYTDYLLDDASCSLDDHIAKTWLLCENATEAPVAYMSLIADAIKLSFTEKTALSPTPK
jgi:hypothetical protein